MTHLKTEVPWRAARSLVAAALTAVIAGTAVAESSLVVRIDYPTEWLTLNHRIVQSLLQSDTVSGTLRRQLREEGALPEDESIVLALEPLQERDHGRAGWAEVVGELKALTQSGRGRANSAAEQQALRRAPALLRRALLGLAASERERSQQQLATAEQQLQYLTQHLAEAQAKRGELIAKAGGTLPQRDELIQTLADLQQRRERAALTLQSLGLREAAMIEQIQKLAQHAETAVQQNALVRDLQQLLQMHEDQMTQARKLAENQGASENDVVAALDALVRVRTQLEEQRLKAVEPTRAEIERLGQMLRNLALDRAEVEADRAAAEQRLRELQERKVLELSDQYEREFRDQIGFLESQLSRLRAELFELRRSVDNFRDPQLQVIGEADSEDDKETP